MKSPNLISRQMDQSYFGKLWILKSPELWVESIKPRWFLVACNTQILWGSFYCTQTPMKTKLRWWPILLWKVYEEEMAGTPKWFCLTLVRNLSCSSSRTYKNISLNVCDQINFRKHRIALKFSSDCILLFCLNG